MALTKVKKITTVSQVVTEVSEKQKKFKDLKALRRAAFIKHKQSGGGDYTRVKKTHYRCHSDE